MLYLYWLDQYFSRVGRMSASDEEIDEARIARRRFLKTIGGAYITGARPLRRLLGSTASDSYVPAKGDIRVPETDENWQVVREFVTEPGPEYRHASDAAFESFRDIKYGVRIHWGLYCLQNWSD